LYSAPEFTVIFGNVATYSIIPVSVGGLIVDGAGELRLVERDGNVFDSNVLTFDASPLFTVTIATTSPLDLSTPNIVIITLKISAPFPLSACTGFIVVVVVVVRRPAVMDIIKTIVVAFK
jgi:hypothetical protein